MTETAIILAAGRGKRLYGETTGRQKCAELFRGETILNHLIKQVEAVGVKEIICVVGHASEHVLDTTLSVSANLQYCLDDNICGTARSFRLTQSIITAENFMVLDGDIRLNEKDLRRLKEQNTGLACGLFTEDFEAAPTHRLLIRQKNQYSICKGSPSNSSIGRICGAWKMNLEMYNYCDQHEDLAGCIERLDSSKKITYIDTSGQYKHFAVPADFCE